MRGSAPNQGFLTLGEPFPVSSMAPVYWMSLFAFTASKLRPSQPLLATSNVMFEARYEGHLADSLFLLAPKSAGEAPERAPWRSVLPYLPT
jgi:hypothetical protein